ncbi:hypothetical protein Ancab_039401 [Ancistrocladus abbreviatus]
MARSLTRSGPAASSAGFTLPSGAPSSVEAQTSWSGCFWPRTLCSYDATGNFRCATGDCGTNQISCSGMGEASPGTLIEFTLNGGGNQDFYDVSLVDNFNARCRPPHKGAWPEYCCTGDHSAVETCASTNYSQIFKQQCPKASSYAFDDEHALVE